MEMLTALDDLESAWDKLASLPLTTVSAGQVLAVLDRLETQRRRQPAVEHALLNHLQVQATTKDMGAKSWRAVLAQRLGISGPDAGRRLAEATALGPRRALTGEPLEPHINELTLACGCDNRLVNDTPTGWATRKRKADNRTEWIPPPSLDRGQHRINHYHHR
jgi:hypothetical protein